MKKVCFVVLALAMLAVTVAFAVAQPVSNEQACKMLGDFGDSRAWDVELEYVAGSPWAGLRCVDPVDGRQYEATSGAMDIIFDHAIGLGQVIIGEI